MSRINRFIPIRVVELKASRGWNKLSPAEAMKKEAELLVKRLPPNPFLVLLDVGGKEMNSAEFAEFLERARYGRENLVFAVGGPFGVHESLREEADLLLSLSPFTFTHDLARLVLVEQLYRACTINAGIPYHY